MGGFPTIRHDEITDITASLLTEIRPNVASERPLQPLSGETIRLASSVVVGDDSVEAHVLSVSNKNLSGGRETRWQ